MLQSAVNNEEEEVTVEEEDSAFTSRVAKFANELLSHQHPLTSRAQISRPSLKSSQKRRKGLEQ